MKNRIWVVVLSIVTVLASCQSSRFMQDDMYFTQIDAIREVREYAINKNSASKANTDLSAEVKSNSFETAHANNSDASISRENYYDYSYSSRVKRFNTENNTWGYYDPYYTNAYWYNNSNATSFGSSVYSTYSWWAPAGNRGSSVNSGINKGVLTSNMYYNSFDNNCYWSNYSPLKLNESSLLSPVNFVQVMQTNGISRDVTIRPAINYTALRESNRLVENSTEQVVENDSRTNVTVVVKEPADNSNKSANTNVASSNKSTNTNSNITTNNKSTYKRWDNYNADVNIAPTNDNNSHLSRSGVFSEGSRNNNYDYKGSALPNNKTKGSTTKSTKVGNSNGQNQK